MAAGSLPLDPQRVYQAWLHECERNGKRGAYKRVGDRYGKSDERIRQIVVKYEASQATVACAPGNQRFKPKTLEADDLTYVPPPDAYATPEPRAIDDALLRQLLTQTGASPVMSRPSVEAPDLANVTWQKAQGLELPELLTTHHDLARALLLFGEVVELPTVDLRLGRHTALLSVAAMVCDGAAWPGWGFALLPFVLVILYLALPR